MSERTCATCHWWDAIPEVDETFGLCCIRAPQREYRRTLKFGGRSVEFASSLPPIYRNNRCGEHQPREVENG